MPDSWPQLPPLIHPLDNDSRMTMEALSPFVFPPSFIEAVKAAMPSNEKLIKLVTTSPLSYKEFDEVATLLARSKVLCMGVMAATDEERLGDPETNKATNSRYQQLKSKLEDLEHEWLRFNTEIGSKYAPLPQR